MTKARILAQVVSAGNVLADGQIGLVELGLNNVSNIPDNAKEVLSATKWATARTLNYSGDAVGSSSVDGSQDVTTTLTLSTSGVTAGTYGSSTNIPQITVDAKGRVTTVSNVAVLIPSGSLTFTGDVSGSGSTGSSTTLTLATIADSGTGTFKKITTNNKGLVTGTTSVTQNDITELLGASSISNTMLANSAVANLSGTNTGDETLTTIKTKLGISTLSGSNTGDQTITLTGDITGSGTGSFITTLANSGVAAGTYTKITVDTKGRATTGTTLTATDIPNLDASKITTGVLDAARLPSYVDDVLEYTNLAGFPATGETGKIYVDLTTNKTYRWSGSVYVYITSGAVDSVAGKTGVVTLVKGDVGLGSVDNTADAAKNVLSATKLTTARTINGVSFDGSANITLTATATNALTIGSYLTGTSYNGSSAVTIAVDATNLNTASKVVARDASGNFSAGTITAALSGNATTATTLATSRNINGVAFNGSADITITAANPNALTIGTGLSGTSYNGSAAVTVALATAYGDTTNPYASKTANYVLAAPNGTAGVPTFRALVAADIPTLNQNTTGNAATVTNGVYTTGSYADPAWITSLAKSKVGLGNVENTALSTWAGSANITTLGTITTGTWSGTAIALNKLAASTISGVSLGNNLNTLTLNVSGTGLSGSTTYNGSAAATFTVTSNATSANTASTIVARDASGNFSAGTITATGIQHSGLTMTAGTNVDQIYSVTDTLTLTTSWQDTSVNAAELATGSYIVQVTGVNDYAVGGGHYDEYYTGVMSWFASNPNSGASDEIVLHRAGHAPNTGTIFLRTVRTASADAADLKLQIAGTTTNTGTSTYTFKFRRLI